MSTQNDDSQGVVMGVVFGIIFLILSLVLGLVLYKNNRSGAPAGTAAVATTVNGSAGAAALGAGAAGGAAGVSPAAHGGAASATPVGMAAADAASVRVDGGVVKFYFASGKADLATGANEALGDIVKGVAAGKKAVISGYHDTTGDPAKNEELAKQRAFAVRDALKALGIGEDKLDLKKPEVTTAAGSNAEARRVEVSLQ